MVRGDAKPNPGVPEAKKTLLTSATDHAGLPLRAQVCLADVSKFLGITKTKKKNLYQHQPTANMATFPDDCLPPEGYFESLVNINNN